MRNPLAGSLLSAAIAAVIWIVITFATGGSAAFAIGGGLGCGVVVFVIGYSFRRLVWGRKRTLADRGGQRQIH